MSENTAEMLSMKDIYTGQLGIVLLLTPKVKTHTLQLATEYPDNRILFEGQGGSCIPHITLYHAYLVDAPVPFIGMVMDEIAAKLPVKIQLDEVASFGGHFVFWRARKTEALVSLHLNSLKLARYFCPREDVKKENLTLPPEQEENVGQFGHPLVRDQWDPHVTIAYLDEEPLVKTESCNLRTTCARLGLARVGRYGTVTEIISTF